MSSLWADVWTVMRKELLEIWMIGGGGRRGWVGQLILVGVFGVLMPLNAGRAWVETPLPIVIAAFLPYILGNATVTDSFAGERERHTLETLLASRLPDDAIFVGKWLAVMVYACGLAWGLSLVSLVVVNIAHWGEGLLLFSPGTILGVVGAALLSAGFAASLGVLVSLRSATVRQAAQTMSYVVFIFVAPFIIVQLLSPDVQDNLLRTLRELNVEQVVFGGALVVALLDMGLFAAARTEFRRAQLILD